MRVLHIRKIVLGTGLINLVASGALELDGMDDFATEIGMLGLKFRRKAGRALVELDDDIRRRSGSDLAIDDLLCNCESEPKGHSRNGFDRAPVQFRMLQPKNISKALKAKKPDAAGRIPW